jgi:phage tail sheath protein FI
MNLTSSAATKPKTISFAGGQYGYSESNTSLATVASGYDLFASAEDIDISLILAGKPIGGSTTSGGTTVGKFQLANYLIDNIAEVRKDCVVFITPDDAVVTGNINNEATALVNWRNVIHDSTYAVLDSGYKYQYDKYNDVYRYLPMNGDIAGLCARTDNQKDPWWSPAGFNRGQIKNLVKVRWNPHKADRDIIYKNGINPVMTSPGQGTVLFGDKTLQSKPSAFDRINVRRLFIVLEKAIATASKFTLFEFNDEFTRAQFKNLVTPYLRDVQGRRGITDFLVVCDASNNTAERIDRNEFWGDIYIKPARSINFIQLNFVAVRSGVQFSEIVGQF